MSTMDFNFRDLLELGFSNEHGIRFKIVPFAAGYKSIEAKRLQMQSDTAHAVPLQAFYDLILAGPSPFRTSSSCSMPL